MSTAQQLRKAQARIALLESEKTLGLTRELTACCAMHEIRLILDLPQTATMSEIVKAVDKVVNELLDMKDGAQ